MGDSFYVDGNKQIMLDAAPDWGVVRALPPGPAVGWSKLKQLIGPDHAGRLIPSRFGAFTLVPVSEAAGGLAKLQKSGKSLFNGLWSVDPVYRVGRTLLVQDGLVNADLSGVVGAEALVTKQGALIAAPPSSGFPFHVLRPILHDALTLANRLVGAGVPAQPRFHRFVPWRPSTQTSEDWLALKPADARWVANMLGIDEVWQKHTRGQADIIVAIDDCGVDVEHPELMGALLAGENIVAPGKPPTPGAGGGNEHGTCCTGIIAATGQNPWHVSGLAPGCCVLPVKIGEVNRGFLEAGPGFQAQGIYASVQRGAAVISNSYGGYAQDQAPDFTVRRAIQYARSEGRNGKGCVVLASAGESQDRSDVPVMYPAAYEGVIAVAATDRSGKRYVSDEWASAVGPEVALAAPGIDVYTTDIRGAGGAEPGNYHAFAGTSAATPIVAAIAALMLSVNPRLTANAVAEILRQTAGNGAGNARNDEVGHGVVNAINAVEAASKA